LLNRNASLRWRFFSQPAGVVVFNNSQCKIELECRFILHSQADPSTYFSKMVFLNIGVAVAVDASPILARQAIALKPHERPNQKKSAWKPTTRLR